MIPLAMPLIGAKERAAVDAVLRSGMLAQGAEVAAFESEFAEIVQGRRCIAVNSGTSALHLGMLAAGIGPGDEVIVPSFTFAATANAVKLCGADPIFVDIEPASFGIDVHAVEAAVTPRTAAVVVVALFGLPPRMGEIAELCTRRGLLLIEDAAQAHGAKYEGRSIGAWGDVAAFSFYPTKNMTTGEGGMIVTADAAIERAARLLRNQGMERRYYNEVVGFNVRMTETAAAMGRVQLEHLAVWNETRRCHAALFDARLTGVRVPSVVAGAVHVYHQYTVRSGSRDELARHLAGCGVGTAVYYPTPVHQLPVFAVPVDLPETAKACSEVLSLPVGPHLTEADVTTIIDAVNSFSASTPLADVAS